MHAGLFNGYVFAGSQLLRGPLSRADICMGLLCGYVQGSFAGMYKTFVRTCHYRPYIGLLCALYRCIDIYTGMYV